MGSRGGLVRVIGLLGTLLFFLGPQPPQVSATREELCRRENKLTNDPEIRVKGSSRANHSAFSSAPYGHLDLVCSAPYPVQWAFTVFQLWAPWSTRTDRVGGANFTSTLSYPRLRNLTQLRNDFPTCHKVNDVCVQSSISVKPDGSALVETRGYGNIPIHTFWLLEED